MKILENISLKKLTTLKIGGEARYFVFVASTDELKKAVVFAREKNAPFVVLGGGSNILVCDKGFVGLVIKVGILGMEWGGEKLKNKSEKGKTKEKSEENTISVIAGAGESWDALVAETVSRGLWGIENLSGIPGTVGAAPVQNIGAYGVEFADVAEWVEVFDSNLLKTSRLLKNECQFGYRESVFKKKEGKHFIITRVALRLRKDGTPNLEYKDLRDRFKIYDLGFKKEEITPQEIRNAVLEIRIKKFPDLRKCGTAGSFFKNPIIPLKQFDKLKNKFPDLPGFEVIHSFSISPSKDGERKRLVKISLAWVLDNICGLKGFAKGDVALFEQQPIVLVNVGDATGEEVKEFAEDIARQVKEKTGIEIEPEVAFL